MRLGFLVFLGYISQLVCTLSPDFPFLAVLPHHCPDQR
jgi:hypothetical protein